MLPRSERLRRRQDFAAVYARKKSWANALLVLYVRRYESGSENSETRRIGFSVSKKVGKAHERNRLKRRLREICRTQLPDLRRPFDAVFVVRAPANAVNFTELAVATHELFHRAGLFLKPKGQGSGSVTRDATPNRRKGSFPAVPNAEEERQE
jgi:ribonuclease P protein component